MGIFDDLPGIFTSVFSNEETIVVTPPAGAPRDVTGRAIFRSASQMIAVEGEDFISGQPELHLAEADAAGLDEGAAVSVDGEEYRIVSRMTDGRGMARFPLHKA